MEIMVDYRDFQSRLDLFPYRSYEMVRQDSNLIVELQTMQWGKLCFLITDTYSEALTRQLQQLLESHLYPRTCGS
jgi:hypothetical protein